MSDPVSNRKSSLNSINILIYFKITSFENTEFNIVTFYDLEKLQKYIHIFIGEIYNVKSRKLEFSSNLILVS